MSCKERKNDAKIMAENAIRQAEKQNTAGQTSIVDMYWSGSLHNLVFSIPNIDDIVVITKQAKDLYVVTMAVKNNQQNP